MVYSISRQEDRQEDGKKTAGRASISSIPGTGWWTTERVETRLRKAMDALRRLPDGPRRLLQALGGDRRRPARHSGRGVRSVGQLWPPQVRRRAHRARAA